MDSVRARNSYQGRGLDTCNLEKGPELVIPKRSRIRL